MFSLRGICFLFPPFIGLFVFLCAFYFWLISVCVHERLWRKLWLFSLSWGELKEQCREGLDKGDQIHVWTTAEKHMHSRLPSRLSDTVCSLLSSLHVLLIVEELFGAPAYLPSSSSWWLSASTSSLFLLSDTMLTEFSQVACCSVCLKNSPAASHTVAKKLKLVKLVFCTNLPNSNVIWSSFRSHFQSQ